MTRPLLPSDFDTPLWRWLEDRFRADLQAARTELENPSLDDKPLSGVRLRARIKQIEDYLKLPAKAQEALENDRLRGLEPGFDG